MAKEVAGLIKLQIKGGLTTRRPCFGFKGYQYHGILQGVQRQNPG